MALLVVAALLPLAHAATLPPNFLEIPAITGLTQPTAVRFAPNGQIFVAEKRGIIKVYDSLADTSPTQVIDLRTQVHNFWDRGLLGLAIHPAYPIEPYIYALYVYDAGPGGTAPTWGAPGADSDGCPNPPGDTADGCVVSGRLSRIQVDPVTFAGSETVLIGNDWCQQYPSHAIGDLDFDPSGMLIATGGDGASFNFADWGQRGIPRNPCGDPPTGVGGNQTSPTAEGGALRSQDIRTTADPLTLDGAVIRIDPITGAAAPDNPLIGGDPKDDRIIAYGLRNPFRMTVRPGTHEVWIADVGWNVWEEVNRIPDARDGVVENFGWPCREGPNVQTSYQPLNLCAAVNASPANRTEPYYAYRHADPVVSGDGCPTGGSSITGSQFYVGGDYPPEYDDAYFFADSTRRCIWAMHADGSGQPNPATRSVFVANASGRVVDVQSGPGGDLFYVDFDGGVVYRLDYFVANVPPTALLVANPTSGPAPLVVDLDASGSTDPEDGVPTDFDWDLDNDGEFDDASGPVVQTTLTSAGVHVVRVRVGDSGGASAVAAVALTADNTPPVPAITTLPLAWQVGDLITLEGEATDPQDGPLPASQLEWGVILHHCFALDNCHTHPIQTFEEVASIQFTAPDHEYPSFLEVTLTASDLGTSDWLDPAWSRRRALTFDNALQSEDLDGFPVLVVLDPTRIDYSLTQPGGADLRFVDPDGALLPHEIEVWDPVGESLVWVRVPRIDGGSSADFARMYYGNPAAADIQDADAVWDASYAGVWHLDAGLGDASGNGNDAVDTGSTDAPGFVGRGRSFDGNDYLNAGNDASLDLTGPITLSAWMQIDDPGLVGQRRILSKKAGTWDGPGYNLEYGPANNRLTSVGSGSNYLNADVDLDTGWHWVTAAASGTTGAVYVDGVDVTGDSTLSARVSTSANLNIGRASWNSDYFVGRLDEVRVESVARSADWIAAQYLSMTDALIVYGPEEQPATLSATTSLELDPLTVLVELETVPAGLELGFGSGQEPAPYAREVIVGSSNSLQAPAVQNVLGVDYVFTGWSHGGDAQQLVVAPAAAVTFTANYVAAGCGNGFLEAGEDCDDANTADGDCCSASCLYDAPGTLCAADLNACTDDVCDGAGTCTHPDSPPGTPCDDGDACSEPDTCSAGTCSGTPLPDGDADGSCDLIDNCPHTPNAGQSDVGGVGASGPDGIGDACQCGDLDADGDVDAADADALRAALADPAAPLSAQAQALCSVWVPGSCDLVEWVVLRRAAGGLPPPPGQACTAAQP